MADLRPFRAYRPRPDIVGRVASPPYDVINTAEAKALAEGNPFSFLHVTRPEIDLPAGTDVHAAVGLRFYRMIDESARKCSDKSECPLRRFSCAAFDARSCF